MHISILKKHSVLFIIPHIIIIITMRALFIKYVPFLILVLLILI